MDLLLTDVEVRILGCLIEKEVTTPDYYPLTLNALIHACNQKSNREPVVSYDERTVEEGIEELRRKNIVSLVHGAGSRVDKFRHRFNDLYDLDRKETAILCLLMLRGPQTPGEIRSRTERFHPFQDLEEVDESLQGLMNGETPWVMKLPRQVGRKERRFVHLLSGKPEVTSLETAMEARSPVQARNLALEEEVKKLKEDLNLLREEFDQLKRIVEGGRRNSE